MSGTVLDSGVTAVKKRSVTSLPHRFCILERDDIIKQINNMISLFKGITLKCGLCTKPREKLLGWLIKINL